MKYVLENFIIETTRRCNMRCEHCMRGESQNIDISKEYIDYILNNKDIIRIGHICFSGGEPTLNPDIITYAINKIITENIDVRGISMVTNGKIFNKDIVDAFNKFNLYRNERVKKELQECPQKYRDQMIASDTDNHARITFSVDKYHYPISDSVKENYKKYAKGLIISEHDLEDERILKTGLSNFGKEFRYKLNPVVYSLANNDYWIISPIYITATGFITSEGDGAYSDMDKINMGNISNINIEEILYRYGEPVSDRSRVMFHSDTKRK